MSQNKAKEINRQPEKLSNSAKFAKLILLPLNLLRICGSCPVDINRGSLGNVTLRIFWNSILPTYIITTIMYALNHHEDMTVLTENIVVMTTVACITNRIFFLEIWSEKFSALVTDLRVGIKRYELNIQGYKEDIEKISAKNHRQVNIVSYGLIIQFAATIILFILSPLIREGTRLLPFSARVPFDSMDSPYYEIDYLFNVLVCLASFIQLSGFDVLFMQISVYICTEMEILQYYLRTVGTNSDVGQGTNEALVDKELIKYCVETHITIIEYVNSLREAYKYSIMIHFGFSSITVGFCVMQFSIKLSSDADFYFGANETLCSAAISLLFFICYVSQLIRDTGLATSDAALENQWFLVGSANARDLQMIVLCAQQPLGLTNGGFSDIDINIFISIMQFAYSIYTLFGV